MTALHGMQWQVRYDVTEPVTNLQFARSPDDSRPRTWLPDQGFEIVRTERGDVARRKDGGLSHRSISDEPDYSVLPKDYAPFSPFGDGGMLFHTGRLFACAGHCAGDESWSMDLWADDEDRIVLDGKTLQARAHWTDHGEGRVVYVGKGVPRQTRDFIAVIDAALPDDIRGRLLVNCRSSCNCSRRSSARYPASHAVRFVRRFNPKGWGRQGGVLRDQIFTHFYGGKWPARCASRSSRMSSRGTLPTRRPTCISEPIRAGRGDAWIHEGAAEAFAAIALRPLAGAFVRSTRDTAASKCAALVEETLFAMRLRRANSRPRTAADAAEPGGRRQGTNGDRQRWSLCCLGRLPQAPVPQGSCDGEALYLEAISEVGGADTAAWLRNAVATPRWRAD